MSAPAPSPLAIVDAALDRFKHVVNFANAQQVARLLVRQERQRPLENLVHIALRFAERPADAVPTLGSDQRCDLSLGLGLGHLVSSAGERKTVPVTRHHAVHEMDLLDRRAQRLVLLQCRRDVDRPPLRPDTTSRHALEVGVELRQRTGDVELAEVGIGKPKRPGQAA